MTNLVLNRKTCADLITELSDDGGESRIKGALARWRDCPSAEVAGDTIAIWSHETARLPEDRRRALFGVAKGASGARAA